MPTNKRPRTSRDDGSEAEASFSDGSEDESDSEEEEVVVEEEGAGSDGDDDGGGRRKTVSQRLKRVKSVYRADAKRSLEWVLERVGEAEARLETQRVSTPQPPELSGCTLHEYQLHGLRWLAALYRAGLSGILADEMGLGKTAQAIALLAHLRHSGIDGPFLVIAPLSTLSGWEEQLSTYCPALRVVRYAGTAAERAHARRGVLGPWTVLLSSYEPVVADAPELRGAATWTYAVLDEAHRLKSRESSVYRCLLDELGLGSVPRLLLTGED